MYQRRKALTDEELLKYLEDDNVSEIDILSDDGIGFDESEQEENQNTEDLLSFVNPDFNDLDLQDIPEDVLGPQENIDDGNTEPPNPQVSDNFYTQYNLTKKENISWIDKSQYQSPKIKWYTKNRVEPVVELNAPIIFFMRYLTDNIFEQMANMTNLYATQKNITRFVSTNIEEIKKFIGIHIVMGNLQFPRVEMYWSSACGIDIIKGTMNLKRFYKLRTSLHLVDITSREATNTDRLWKVRCIYDALKARYRELPLERNLCVDEQIVPFKGKLNIKQYVKNKPKKWGVKIYILAGESGMIYDFIIYQGSTTEINPLYTTNCGSSAAVVMQLSERISEPNHALFFDNFFSSYHLFQFLNSKSVYAAGTVRLNRFYRPKLLGDKEMKKKERGSAAECVSKDGVVVTKWYDNKPVVMGSNFVGIGEQDVCRRWDKQKKRVYSNI